MDANIRRALNDRTYEKRKGGALQLENQIRSALYANDHDRIQTIIEELCKDFAFAVHLPNARNGGLIALAAVSIALGPEVARYLNKIAPAVVPCFVDHDKSVRYYACESMYNIAKVAKGEILPYFNDIFDALSKLAADSELSVKNGAELLDRLVKDIVSESAASFVSVLEPSENVDDNGNTAPMEEQPLVDTEAATAFSLARFIPLLVDRLHVLDPHTRSFLVSWINLLDSIPDLELVSYLPSFLGGLFKFLSDTNPDIRNVTRTTLERFLNEIKKMARIKRGIAESWKSIGESGQRQSYSSERSAGNVVCASSEENSTWHNVHEPSECQETHSADSDSTVENDENARISENDWIPGQDVQVDYPKILEILMSFLSDPPEEEIQLTALKWIDNFFEICPEDILVFIPRLLSQVLPALSNDVEEIRQTASHVNTSLSEYIASLPDVLPKSTSLSAQIQLPSRSGPARDMYQGDRQESTPPSKIAVRASNRDVNPEIRVQMELKAPSSVETTEPPQQVNLDYEAAANALTLQFLNEHETTRVAALAWLIMLHQKAPQRILAINDGTFPALLKTLSDPSETVVACDLVLLSQISRNKDDLFFKSFMVNLLKIFCTDRRLLETRGNFIIRKICVNLSGERIYRTLADCLEKDEDVEFASIMVQNLNNNLITAPELSDLRKRLRNLDTRDGQALFGTLFRSWCHNAVAVFSLCLLAQAYEQAYYLLQIFAEFETTVNMLIQIDKLVQLLESPVFTYLRLQLLEPERFPYLYKCLYGLLMLLPQSSAFAALKNRLNSVSAIGYLDMAARPSSTNFSNVPAFERPGRLKARDEGVLRWAELREKFRVVQERAKRFQKIANSGEHDGAAQKISDPHGMSGAENQKAEVQSHSLLNQKIVQSRPLSSQSQTKIQSNQQKSNQQTSAQTQSKSKSNLSHLGRFAGGVGSRKTKR